MTERHNVHLVRQRSVELKIISEDRKIVALARNRVTRLDQALAANWGIDFHDGQAIEDLLPRTVQSGAVAAYWLAHDRVGAALKKNDDRLVSQSSADLHDALADPAVLGPVTSSRRAFILDAAALVIGLSERLDLDGPILDAGCHAGFVTQLLAQGLKRPTVGIDPSALAIQEGRRRSTNQANVRLIAARIPWDTDERFGLILAIDSMPDEPTEMGQFLRGIGGLLNPGGVAVVVSMHWVNVNVERLRVHLRAAQLGFCYADVVGGYVGFPPSFDTEGAVVFIKGDAQTFPRQLAAMMEREWPFFREYANDPMTPKRQKTQAFERAVRKARTL